MTNESLVPGQSIIVPAKTLITFGFDIPAGAYTLTCVDGDVQCAFVIEYWSPEKSDCYSDYFANSDNAGKCHTVRSHFRYTRYWLEYYTIYAETRIKLTVADPFVFK